MTRTLPTGFLRSAEKYPDRPALEVDEARYTYAELRNRAQSLAATLSSRAPDDDSGLTAVFAYRTLAAYSGVLASLLRGHGYVPLNRTFPPARSRSMLELSGCRTLIADLESAKQFDEILPGLPGSLLILLPETEDVSLHAERWPQHVFLGASDLEPAGSWAPVEASPESIAYLLFTSGSTGRPKGVMVAHKNVLPFIDVMTSRYGITERDRFSQTFDLTFDLSAFDMFVAWESGAALCCPSAKALINPGNFIRRSELSVWFSVPSTGVFMKRLGSLKADRFPTLRWSLFCGEPLPVTVAESWAEAAPNSILENLYGPTEVTIACMFYRWDAKGSPQESVMGVVPIGEPYQDMLALVVNDRLEPVAPGEEGELVMNGPQVTPGYWHDEEKTRAVFVQIPGVPGSSYRTGDWVRRPVGPEPMVYLRRVDHQIKIQGHRVELGEVEAVIREESSQDAVLAVGWPRTESGASGLVVFIGAENVDTRALLKRLQARLPGYMVPREVIMLNPLPLNPNGKFDRNALLKILEDRS